MPVTEADADRPATIGEVLRSLVFYPLFYGGTVPLLLLCLATLSLPPRALVTMVHCWCRWHRWCCRHILNISVVVQGTLPPHPVLYAIRHEAYFEAIDLPNLLGEPMVFAKKELMAIPVWGLLGHHYGLISVDREGGARALRAMIAAARAGGDRPLAIFPEGTRVAHDAAPPLQAGFAGLYKLLDRPVVPIAIDSGPIYHRRWKRAGVVHYRIGAEIPVGLPRAEVEAAVHRAINALHD
jgi:1-acyl-sn-glycerol-3-phosphate acyltransferase